MKSLTGRIFLILVLATAAIQVLSFGGVLAYVGYESRRAMYEFMAADLDFVRKFLRDLPAAQRADWLARLNRGYYEIGVQPRAEQNPLLDERSLRNTAAPVQRRVGADVPVRPVLIARSNLKGLELPIDNSDKLIVSFEGGEPFAPPPLGVILGYLALVLLTVMPFAWLAVRISTRPLARLASAARAFGSNLNAPAVAETGTTEVAAAARAFNTMRIAIRKHLDERTRILASISHDLKTPLTRLRLRLGAMAPPEQRARCEADIDAMTALVQEGLDYAASEQVRERRVPLDMNRLVEDLVERAGDVGARVEASGRLDAPVECAPRALERALQNLVDNALKHGGGRTRIALARHDNGVEIRVEDEGPGLPPELLERAFDPFFRAEQSRNRETGGTGLGLSIARNLVRAQGGEIELANRESGGLVATVRLPVHGVA